MRTVPPDNHPAAIGGAPPEEGDFLTVGILHGKQNDRQTRKAARFVREPSATA
ncbi:MAG: hypothetical protein LBL66_09830 [Clostridiales bacterium]|nr:hypothetical protein [Clostridiales bacterium]